VPNRNRENDEGPTTYQVIVYEVEAMKVTAADANQIARWCGGEVTTDVHPVDKTVRFSKVGIPTMKGVLWALDGEYVVKWPGPLRFTVMTRNEFESFFEPAKGDDVE
jgi:hypothetical protein